MWVLYIELWLASGEQYGHCSSVYGKDKGQDFSLALSKVQNFDHEWDSLRSNTGLNVTTLGECSIP